MPDKADSGERRSLDKTVGHMAHLLKPGDGDGDHRINNGDVASLRRLDPSDPFSPAVWKVLSIVLDDEEAQRMSEERERRWAVIIGAMAQGPPHAYGMPLGTSLAAHNWSEVRLVRLLEARGQQLFDHVRRMAQYLRSKGATANYGDLARLILFQEGDAATGIRHRIAKHYYRQLHRQSN